MSAAKKTPYDAIFAGIMDQLDAGVAPWRKPWKDSFRVGAPVNVVSGAEYRGANRLLLSMAQANLGYTSAKYATYKQWQANGRNVMSGAKGLPIVFWNFVEVDGKQDTGAKVSAGAGATSDAKKIPFVRYYTVFNESQLVDYVAPMPDPEAELAEITEAETVGLARAHFDRSLLARVTVHHGGNVAVYRPHLDTIQVPPVSQFESGAEYASTLFHELGQATGHESRMKRDLTGMFGDHKYSKEELIAELFSAIQLAEAGIEAPAVTENQAAYCKGWLKKFRDQPKEMLSAFTHAAKACDYFLGRSQAVEPAAEQTGAGIEAVA